MTLRIALISTGAANLASVRSGLERAARTLDLPTSIEVVDEPREVERADCAVLPGVGAFGPAAARLSERGLDRALTARVEADRPTLAICLGMQLLGAGSDENPLAMGMGLHDGRATRFSDEVSVPQLGWNRIRPEGGCELLRPGWVYFANTYRLLEPPPGWRAALSEHGGSFVGALERGNVLACQFHPELSGAFGIELLGRWMSRSAQRFGREAQPLVDASRNTSGGARC